jgi:hypothetical protein
VAVDARLFEGFEPFRRADAGGCGDIHDFERTLWWQQALHEGVEIVESPVPRGLESAIAERDGIEERALELFERGLACRSPVRREIQLEGRRNRSAHGHVRRYRPTASSGR